MELLEKALTISLFCVGLRIMSSKGMILYFLRMPYESISKEIKRIKKLNKKSKYLKKEESLISFIMKLCYVLIIVINRLILKAVIGCVTCMSGIYTIILELSYYSLSKWTILTIFIVACLNSIIYGLYELITAITKHYNKKP